MQLNHSTRSSRKSFFRSRVVQVCFAAAAIGMVGLSMWFGFGNQPIPSPLAEASKLLFEKKYDDALASCDKVLTQDPDYYEAIVLRGEINQKADREAEALADFSVAIQKYPKRPDAYDWRYKIYLAQSEAAPKGERRDKLQELAMADYAMYKLYEPSSALTQVDALPKKLPDSLKKPFAGYDPIADEIKDIIAINVADEKDELAEADPTDETDSVIESQNDSATGRGDSVEKPNDSLVSRPMLDKPMLDKSVLDKSILNPSTEDAEAEIKEGDLANNTQEDDPPLPHGTTEPEAAPLTLPQVTRFDLGTFQTGIQGYGNLVNIPGVGTDGSGVGLGLPPYEPQKRATTGISKQEPEVQPQQPRGLSTPWNPVSHKTSPYLSPSPYQQGVSQPRSTGIRSNAEDNSSPSNPYMGAPVRGQSVFVSPYLAGPAGFLPPSAQGKFGPRIEPGATITTGKPAATEQTGERPRLPLGNDLKGRPIITMALPNTTRFYGGREEKPQVNQFGPNYSPFVQRPAAVQTLPDLPQQ